MKLLAKQIPWCGEVLHRRVNLDSSSSSRDCARMGWQGGHEWAELWCAELCLDLSSRFMWLTTKSNSAKDFCKTCMSRALPVLGHWRAWARHRGLRVWIPWDQSSGNQRNTVPVCCMQGAWRSSRIGAGSNLWLLHSHRQRRRMKVMCFTPSTSLSLAGKAVPSCAEPAAATPFHKTLVWGFRHSQGLWKAPLGCAPILSKHFKEE